MELITYCFPCLVYSLFQLHDIGRYYFLTYLLTHDACFQDLTETHNEWLRVVRLSWLPFRWKEQEVILNTPGCRLSGKNKSIKRKSCFEEQTPFCGLLLVFILKNSKKKKILKLFYQILLCISIFKAEFTHKTGPDRKKRKWTCGEHKSQPAFSFRSFLETLTLTSLTCKLATVEYRA